MCCQRVLEETVIRDAIINVWNCDPVMYTHSEGDTPTSYYAVVREKVRERFTEASGYEHDRHLHAGRNLPSEAAWSGFRYSCVFARWPVLGPGHLQRRPRKAIRDTCDVEAQTLHLPPLPTDSTMHSIGKQALYAFEAADGTIKLGTREEVSTWLQSSTRVADNAIRLA